MTSMVFHIDIVFLYDIDGFSHRYRIRYYINGFSHRYLIRHQWFFTEILYFYMTSMIFPIDIVFIYDIAGFSHRYRMTSMILPIDIVFFCDIYLISPYISYFYMSSTCFPHRYRIFIWHQWFFPQICYQTSMVFHRDIIFLYDINGFPIDFVFLYDIDGFSHRFRIWYDLNGFAHRYRVLIWHRWFFT